MPKLCLAKPNQVKLCDAVHHYNAVRAVLCCMLQSQISNDKPKKRYCKNDALSCNRSCLHSDGVISCFHWLFSDYLTLYKYEYLMWACITLAFSQAHQLNDGYCHRQKTMENFCSENFACGERKIWTNIFCLDELFMTVARNVYCQHIIVLTSERMQVI